jgi:hypothetical protein
MPCLVSSMVPPPSDAEIAEPNHSSAWPRSESGDRQRAGHGRRRAGQRRKLFRLCQSLARDGKLTCRIDLRWPLAGGAAGGWASR